MVSLAWDDGALGIAVIGALEDAEQRDVDFSQQSLLAVEGGYPSWLWNSVRGKEIGRSK